MDNKQGNLPDGWQDIPSSKQSAPIEEAFAEKPQLSQTNATVPPKVSPSVVSLDFPTEPLTAKTSSVVVAQEPDKIPLWFIVLFIMVLIIFISINYLLAQAIKISKDNPILPEKAEIGPTLTEPTAFIMEPTITPFAEEFTHLSESNKTSDIQKDLETTDTTQLDNLQNVFEGNEGNKISN